MDVKLGLSHYIKHRLRVFEDGMLGRILGPNSDEETGSWRKPNQTYDLLLSEYQTIRAIKSPRTRWTGHVARTRA
jgi:hypothetical protein